MSEGHGLDSQVSRCREYTAYKGHEIIEVFRDEAISGGLIDRPGMKRCSHGSASAVQRALLSSFTTSLVSPAISKPIRSFVSRSAPLGRP
ncbi:MAG: recombinase family protein [Pseudomonadota bacterium]